MKTAIMTWFRYYNYGTSLQVSALSEFLRKQGHSVDVIDYDFQNRTGHDRSVDRIHSYKLADYVKLKFQNWRAKKSEPYREPYETESREKLFRGFLGDRITLSRRVELLSELEQLNGEYDAFVCGSDQIWAPSLFDPHFFLDFVYDTGKMIAYAPSIGLPTIQNSYIKNAMGKLIKRFPHLSIREEQGADLIEEVVGRRPEVVVDPTLLLGKAEWTIYAGLDCHKSDEKYLVAYMLGCEEKHWQQIFQLARQKGLSVKIIPTLANDVTREGCIETAIGPKEFLELIAGADYVCTDSFHGTVFSLLFEKQFSVFERFGKADRNNQNSRVHNILKMVDLFSRLVRFQGEPAEEGVIDYSIVTPLLSIAIEKSKKYLTEALFAVETHPVNGSRHVLQENTLCCGCGACAYSCPQGAVAVEFLKKGFWQAVVDEKKCIECGRCKSVCPFESREDIPKVRNEKLYSYKDNRAEVLMKSSSGGIAYALSEMLLQRGYSVVGCTFDNELKRARHCLVSDVSELKQFQGSKYVQSYFADVYRQIEESCRPIVVIGTPCQVAAIRQAFPRRENILCVDLVCHGVPTYHLLDNYISYMSRKYALDREKMSIDFRWKPEGWRERHVRVATDRKEVIQDQTKDLFFRSFEAGKCYMDACYDCRWRDGSVADIRIGDYWGPRFSDDKTGVSMGVGFTEKGRAVLRDMLSSSVGELVEQDIEDMLSYQQMNNNPKPLYCDELIEKLAVESDLKFIVDKYVEPNETFRKSMAERMNRVIRLLGKETLFRIH